MVEKVVTTHPNKLDFARYQAERSTVCKAVAISARLCRHCGAALAEGEYEDECSSALNIAPSGFQAGARKLYAD